MSYKIHIKRRALKERVDKALAARECKLVRTTPRNQREGQYRIVSLKSNCVLTGWPTTLHALAVKLGCLKPYEDPESALESSREEVSCE
jgi:hypothetical protein